MISQEAIDRGIRIRKAEKGARATTETRVALIVAERGLTKKQMAKFWVRRRKNCKPRFDHWAFAKAQDVSTDWLFHGDIRAYPRGTAPRPPGAIPRDEELRQFVRGIIKEETAPAEPDGDDAA
jgi:hypothetical protein